MKKLVVCAKVREQEYWRPFRVTGQVARALLSLVKCGPAGVTAQEVNSWALRFAAYCHELIHKQDLNIKTNREEHVGGWHGRHVLISEVVILSIEGDE